MKDDEKNPTEQEQPANGQDDTIESGGPQPVYGVSMFMLENGESVVHITGKPSIDQIYTLVAERQNRMFINMIADTVVGMMRASQQKSPQIIVPKLEIKRGH